jgi:hypothetical protein
MHGSSNVRSVQRLFSMFPAGAPGAGLLLLRLCVAGMLLRTAMLRPTAPLPFWAAAIVIVLAISLCLGAFTHFGCIACLLTQIALMFLGIEQDRLELAFSLGITSALFLLGPGAYSVDCRRFGRRLILPPDYK